MRRAATSPCSASRLRSRGIALPAHEPRRDVHRASTALTVQLTEAHVRQLAGHGFVRLGQGRRAGCGSSLPGPIERARGPPRGTSARTPTTTSTRTGGSSTTGRSAPSSSSSTSCPRASSWARTTPTSRAGRGAGRSRLPDELTGGLSPRSWRSRSTAAAGSGGWNLLDIRLQKDFKLGETARFAILADGLNVFNNDAYDGVGSRLGTSDSFGVPTDFVLPRRLMLGAKLTF